MEFGENGRVINNGISSVPVEPPMGSLLAPGLSGRPIRKLRRNKLACLLSALLSVLFVSLTGLFFMWLFSIVSIIVTGDADNLFTQQMEDSSLGMGAAFAVMASIGNFFLIWIVFPVTLIVISQTVGRLAHRGISSKTAYVRTMSLTGAALVGLTCTLPAILFMREEFSNQPAKLFGLFIGGGSMGALIGAIAGAFVGMMFLLILRPAAQLQTQDLTKADVF